MNIVRKFVGVFAAIALAVVAAPALAQQPTKIYNLVAVNASTSAAVGKGRLNLTITNATPNGNSSFNSAVLDLVLPSGVTVTGATSSTGTPVITGGNRISIANMSPVKPGKSASVVLTLSGLTCGGSADVGINAAIWTGSSFSGDEFLASGFTEPLNVTATANCNGNVACGAFVPDTATNPDSIDPDLPGYALAIRGWFNQKGETCVNVNVAFANSLLDLEDPNGKSVLHKWDTSVAPSGAFYYKLNGYAKTALTNGLPSPVTPQVSWTFDTSGNPINKHPGRACLSPDLPRPYGELASALDSSTGVVTFTLATAQSLPDSLPYSTPPATPFPIYVGGERMTVTANSGTTWTVQRGGADAAGTTVSSHPVGAFVLSTPLPLNAAGTGVEQVCIVTMGWKFFEPGKYFWFIDAIDIGDGWIGTEN